MKKILHRFAHLLQINKGRPDAFWEGDRLMMSFLCKCGERQGIMSVEDGRFDAFKEALEKRKQEPK